jgi:hypothetical protein
MPARAIPNIDKVQNSKFGAQMATLSSLSSPMFNRPAANLSAYQIGYSSEIMKALNLCMTFANLPCRLLKCRPNIFFTGNDQLSGRIFVCRRPQDLPDVRIF